MTSQKVMQSVLDTKQVMAVLKYCSTIIYDKHDLYTGNPIRPRSPRTVAVSNSSVPQFCNVRFGTKKFQVFPNYKNKNPPLQFLPPPLPSHKRY
jgi:hypothetical protein